VLHRILLRRRFHITFTNDISKSQDTVFHPKGITIADEHLLGCSFCNRIESCWIARNGFRCIQCAVHSIHKPRTDKVKNYVIAVGTTGFKNINEFVQIGVDVFVWLGEDVVVVNCTYEIQNAV
jgi:hypothetical protein